MAGDAYKRELLQQKLSDTEWALAREQDRAKEAESDRAGTCTYTMTLSCTAMSDNGACHTRRAYLAVCVSSQQFVDAAVNARPEC